MAVTAPAPRVLADVLPRSLARDALLIIGGAVFVGIAAQISLTTPLTPVPFTLQTFAVLLTGAALGTVRGMISLTLYAVAGLVGVPWFADASSGFESVSFGYIIGFILGAGLVGYLAERNWTRTALDTALAMVLGNVVIYAFGVVWLKFALPGTTWAGAIALGMSPFLLVDAVKIGVAAGLFPLVWKQLTKRDLAPRASAGPDTTIALSEAETTAETSDDVVIDLTDKSSVAEDAAEKRD